MERYPLRLDGREIGEVSLEREDGRVRAEAVCRLLSDGLYRAYLDGAGGTLLLGVLEPQGGALRVCKRFSEQELRSVGALSGARAAHSFSFGAEDWRPLGEHPFFSEPRLNAALRGIPGALWRDEGARRCLALPYAPDGPFPLTELFCFARIRAVRGRPCVVYRADASGFPIF